MTNKNMNKNDIPNDVLELLPWYAIGNLSTDDQNFFDNALSAYPLLKELLKQELQLVETVSDDKTLLDLSAISKQEERLKSVFNIIDIAEKEEPTKTYSVINKFKNLYNSFVPNSTPQYVPIAGVGILVLSVAVLTAFVTPIFTESNEFIPASAVIQDDNKKTIVSNASNSVLLVGFNGTASELGNNDVLKGKVLRIESVPDKVGFYKILFKESLGYSEAKEIIDELLLQKDLIWFAGESA